MRLATDLLLALLLPGDFDTPRFFLRDAAFAGEAAAFRFDGLPRREVDFDFDIL